MRKSTHPLCYTHSHKASNTLVSKLKFIESHNFLSFFSRFSTAILAMILQTVLYWISISLSPGPFEYLEHFCLCLIFRYLSPSCREHLQYSLRFPAADRQCGCLSIWTNDYNTSTTIHHLRDTNVQPCCIPLAEIRLKTHFLSAFQFRCTFSPFSLSLFLVLFFLFIQTGVLNRERCWGAGYAVFL